MITYSTQGWFAGDRRGEQQHAATTTHPSCFSLSTLEEQILTHVLSASYGSPVPHLFDPPIAGPLLRTNNLQLPQFQDFPLFGGGQILDLLGLCMRNLFHLVQRTFLFILADLLFFLQLVDRFLDVAADVAHRRAVILEHLVQVLHDVLPALFRRRRHRDAHHFAV